ncbi:hypothetical protein NBRC116597_22940 [Phaeobacter sp. NW0010-22]
MLSFGMFATLFMAPDCPFISNEKWGGTSPPSFAIQAHFINRPVFFACGLDVAWNERTRSVTEWEGQNCRPPIHKEQSYQSELSPLRAIPDAIL